MISSQVRAILMSVEYLVQKFEFTMEIGIRWWNSKGSVYEGQDGIGLVEGSGRGVKVGLR